MWLHAKVMMGSARAPTVIAQAPEYDRSTLRRPSTSCKAVQVDVERDNGRKTYNAKAERSAYDPKYRFC